MPQQRATPVGSVMLIEDNPDHALLIQTALEASPHVHNVQVIDDGEQALHYIQAEPSAASAVYLPGLVVLDLKLPKIDGLDILRAIRASPVWQNVPVVILTTSTRPADAEACYADGANSYVAKVMKPDEMAVQVREVVAHWLEATSTSERTSARGNASTG